MWSGSDEVLTAWGSFSLRLHGGSVNVDSLFDVFKGIMNGISSDSGSEFIRWVTFR